MYRIQKVDGREYEGPIRAWNALAPDTFPALQDRHLENGYWWLVYPDRRPKFGFGIIEPVAFAGMVPFEPFPNVGYLKRAFVSPDHRGRGLQLRLMEAREAKARWLGWTQLVSECADNPHSAANFRRAGFSQVEPEQRWGAPNSVYWTKDLT